MFIGLFTEDAKSMPIPGVAESWTISEDQKTWTFKLKQTKWSDGTPLTAHDFVFSFRAFSIRPPSRPARRMTQCSSASRMAAR
jgi:ABC-type transport system substrate-binding protein